MSVNVSEPVPLNLMETFRSVFYTPILVSVAGGFLREEGLDVNFSTCPVQFPHPLSALKSGKADIVQSGIMRCIIALDWGAESVPLHFAEINSRDGFFVLSRHPQPDFQWNMLTDSTVIPVGFSPMPWASFQKALRKHEVDPSGLTLLPGLPLADAIEAFRQNKAGFIHLPQPAAERLIAEGVGHLVAALGTENGHIAYSSFAATTAFLTNHAETVSRFVQGFSRALQWLESNDESDIADAISEFFDETPKELLTKSVGRYKAQGTWPTNPGLEQPEYEGLQEILMAAGLVKEHQPYHKVVTREFA